MLSSPQVFGARWPAIRAAGHGIIGAVRSGPGPAVARLAPAGWWRYIGHHARNVANRVWHVGRFIGNLPSTEVGYTYAQAAGAHCKFAKGLMVVCTDAHPDFIPSGHGGLTIGSVYTTSDHTVDPSVLSHETKHADQNVLLALGDPVLYGLWYAAGAGSSRLLYHWRDARHDSQGRTCNDPNICYNFMEIWSGLHDGHYYH